jgi:hypothetical protein
MNKIRMAVVAAVVTVALYGCGTHPATPSTAGSPTQVLPDPSALCKAKVGNGVPVRFGANKYLGGIVLGSGTTGVVLAHRNGSDLCDWMPYGHVLAARDTGCSRSTSLSSARPTRARTPAPSLTT